MRACWLLLLGGVVAAAQQPVSRLNPTIQKIVDSISEQRIESTLRRLEGFETRFVVSEQDNPTRGIGAAQRWIESELRSYSPRLQVSLFPFEVKKGQRVAHDVKVNNIVALLPGTVHKDRYIIVSAHYDSIVFAQKGKPSLDQRVATAVKEGMNEAEARAYQTLIPEDEVRQDIDADKMAQPDWKAPGVNDDGSGVAAVMELARVMSAYQFEKSILFVAFAGEEIGLVGSGAFAKDAKAKKLQIEAVLNNDIIGNETAGNGRSVSSVLRVFSAGPEDSLPRAVAAYAKEIGERYVPSMRIDMVLRQDRFRRGGDHTPFANAGFGAVRFTTASENYAFQHTVEDTFEHVSVPYNTRVAKVNAAVAASLAMAPAPPQTNWTIESGKNAGAKRGLLGRGKSGYDAALRWLPSPDKDVAGYEVMIRSTANPLWERSIFVGDVKSYTLPDVSIDDVVIGIRAVDREGNPSLVSSYGLDTAAPNAAAGPTEAGAK